jgi:hypothetical protein
VIGNGLSLATAELQDACSLPTLQSVASLGCPMPRRLPLFLLLTLFAGPASAATVVSIGDGDILLRQPVQERSQIMPPSRRDIVISDDNFGCPDPPTPSVTQNAVNLFHSAILTLKTCSRGDVFYSGDSQINLFCVAGKCGVFFDSGRYGYHPLRCSQVRIGVRIWGWCGDQPNFIALEMWPFLIDGIEVASQIARWPSGTTNFREKPLYVKRSKIATYNASLGF